MSSFDFMTQINNLKKAAQDDGASGAIRAFGNILGDTNNLRGAANSLKKSLIDPNLSSKVRQSVQNLLDSGFDILDEAVKANPDKATIAALIERLEEGYDRSAAVTTACKMLGYDDLAMWADTGAGRPYDAENEQLTAVVMTLMKRRLPDWKYVSRPGFARIESPDFKSESWIAGDSHGINILEGSEYMFKAEKPQIALLGAVLKAVEKEAPIVEKTTETKTEENNSQGLNIPTETEKKAAPEELHIPIETEENTSHKKEDDLNIGVEN